MAMVPHAAKNPLVVLIRRKVFRTGKGLPSFPFGKAFSFQTRQTVSVQSPGNVAASKLKALQEEYEEKFESQILGAAGGRPGFFFGALVGGFG